MVDASSAMAVSVSFPRPRPRPSRTGRVASRLNEYVLAIDVGTSGTKAAPALVSSDGAVAVSSYQAHPIPTTSSLGGQASAEQDPQDWWLATKEVINKCLSRVPSLDLKVHHSNIKALAVTGQMQDVVFLQKNRICCQRRAILYSDARATLEAIEFIYEDLPSNLCGIRDRVETLANSSRLTPPLTSPEASHSPSLSASQTANTNGSFALGKLETGASAVNGLDSPDSLNMGPQKKSRKRCACIKGLMDDYRVLEAEVKEFIRAHGVEGMMPMRKHFRQHSRSDLEKAVRAMGGFGTIAARMKLSLSYKERKPLGYWDDLENLRNEVIVAQKALGCDSRVLPSRLSIERAGSYSLARALEKWGGAKETARILGLKTKRLQKNEHRTGKGPVKRSVPDSIIMCESALVNSATLGPDPKAEVEKQMMRDAMVEEDGELSPLGDLPTDPSMRREESNHLLLEHEASLSLSSLPEQYQDRKTTMSYASASGKQTSQSSVNESKHTHNHQAKDKKMPYKKMPYKTGVPQESSKWLTLCTDMGLLDVADESQVY